MAKSKLYRMKNLACMACDKITKVPIEVRSDDDFDGFLCVCGGDLIEPDAHYTPKSYARLVGSAKAKRKAIKRQPYSDTIEQFRSTRVWIRDYEALSRVDLSNFGGFTIDDLKDHMPMMCYSYRQHGTSSPCFIEFHYDTGHWSCEAFGAHKHDFDLSVVEEFLHKMILETNDW